MQQIINLSFLGKITLKAFLSFFCIVSLFLTTKLNAQNSSQYYNQGNDTLIVYKDVPNHTRLDELVGVPEPRLRRLISDKYSIRVRSAATGNQWVDVFANNTYSRQAEYEFNNPTKLQFGNQTNWNYQTFVSSWSHAYGNIEMSKGTEVEVEIAFINGFTIKGQPIFKAAAHPLQKVSSQPVVDGGKIFFKINNPGQITIDINGQLDDHHAAINPMPLVGGKKVPLHTISFYANPIIKKPNLSESSVYKWLPNAKPTPADLKDKTTIAFEPGVHDLGMNFKVYPNIKYYIPGDAVVIGTLNNIGVLPQGIFRAGENIKIYGYGTISNWGIGHPDDVVNRPLDYNDNVHCPIYITDGMNVEINGIAISDPSFHSLKLQSWNSRPNVKSIETVCKWIKIVTWRTNADGIGSAELVEDSFLRTTDDASYIKGDRLRIIFWRETKASAFHMAATPTVNESAPLRIEDCDVIYNRTRDAVFKFNGAIFDQRGEGVSGRHFVDLKIRNIRNHDRLSNAPVISLNSLGADQQPTDAGLVSGSSYHGIVFENINIEANSAMLSSLFPGQTVVKQSLRGTAVSPWDGGITFDNVTFKGVLLTEANFATYFDFNGPGAGNGVYPNDFVKNIFFKNSVNYTLSLEANTNGRISSNPGVEKYTAGTNVILTAIPNPGYEFVSWSGDAAGTVNPIPIVMDSNKAISAVFQKATNFIFNAAGSGNWTVPAGVTSITLKAWSGGGAGGSTFKDVGATGNFRGGGGAGGSYASKTITVTPGDIINFTIGKGGAGSALGFANLSSSESGGNTFADINGVQTVVQALGGVGGQNISSSVGSNGTGGIVLTTGNIGDEIRLGGNGGNAGGIAPNVGSGCGGGSAGTDGVGGAGQSLNLSGAAGLGGGADGGKGTNSTTTTPFKGEAPGGGGAGSTVRTTTTVSTFIVGAGGGSGKFVIAINDNLNVADIDNMSYKYIYVYPNPVSDNLYINSTLKDIKKIEIIDATGKVVYIEDAFEQNESIDVTRFNKGFYVLKIQTFDNAIHTSKIIIK